MFQFQNGSINRLANSSQKAPPLSFNSKMVRLIVTDVLLHLLIALFQFQNGSINSGYGY